MPLPHIAPLNPSEFVGKPYLIGYIVPQLQKFDRKKRKYVSICVSTLVFVGA